MKKILTLVLVILIISSLTLVGCSNNSKIVSPGETEQQVETQQHMDDQKIMDTEQQVETQEHTDDQQIKDTEQQNNSNQQSNTNSDLNSNQTEDNTHVGLDQNTDPPQYQPEEKEDSSSSILDIIESAIMEKLNKEGQKFKP